MSVPLFLSHPKRMQAEFSGLKKIVLATALCCGLPLAQAQEQTPYALPNPLTLQDVMSASLQAHPLLATEQANLAKIQAQLGAQQAQDGLQLDLVGRLAWRDYAKETEEFHLAALHARQSLYDFDRNRSQVEALQRHEEAQTLLFENAENQLKLQLMQGFFNVLLADFQYRIDNEAMAVAYVGLDKAKDELDLKRLSDVDYLKLENEYQQILVKRSRSEYQQLQTRLALANLMGLPDARPDELTFPALKNYAQRSLNETTLEKLQQNVLQENPELNALKKRLEAAQLKVQSQQAAAKPDIALEGWAGQLSSYPEKREGNWNIGLTLNMPLYDSGLRDAKVSEAKADEQAVAAQIGLYEQKLRDKVADIYFQIKLLEAERNQNKIFGDYADLYLDYSRALYENESKTDLGDAMVRLSEANYNQVAWQFKQALLWASLDSLTGKALFENAEASNSQAQQAELPQ
ncbi:MAG: TolC family protein [Thiotrichales bacterium]|nr:TolC family protein [Thiotrichales bacterium]